MKQAAGISASLTAIASALASISCCLPLGFAAAIGAAGSSAFVTTARPWLLGLSVALLGVGFWQQRRAKACNVKGRLLSQALLAAAVVIVGSMILFPQQIAGFIADVNLWGPSSTPPAQPQLLSLSAANFQQFEAAFDAADSPRLVLMLSPT